VEREHGLVGLPLYLEVSQWLWYTTEPLFDFTNESRPLALGSLKRKAVWFQRNVSGKSCKYSEMLPKSW